MPPLLLLLTFLALPPLADRDPRCNTAARYEAMAQGANCSGSEGWPKTHKPKDRK